MELECGITRHERSEERVNCRNGYRQRSFETRIGKLDPKIRKPRSGSYSSRKTSDVLVEEWTHTTK